MRPYDVRLTRVAVKDVEKLTPKLRNKLRQILSESISRNPYGGKRLVGDLAGFFSFRLSFKDRIVYSIDKTHRTVFVHRARTHYGD